MGSLEFSVALGRDDGLGARFSDPVDEMVGIIALVGDCRFGVDTLDQVMKTDRPRLLLRNGQSFRRSAFPLQAWSLAHRVEIVPSFLQPRSSGVLTIERRRLTMDDCRSA